MLLGFQLKNWKSFKNETVFSAYASLERTHSERLSRIKNRNRITPIGLIFGGNASGKSAFISALSFLKDLVTTYSGPNRSINIKPFLLGGKDNSEEISFVLQMLINESIYTYEITINRKAILKERLVEKRKNNDKLLFERNEDNFTFGSHFSSSKKKILTIVGKGTASSKLFVTNTVDQQLDDFRMIYDWFDTSLIIITPDSTLRHDLSFDHPNLYKAIGSFLSQYDTGIHEIDQIEIDIKSISLEPEIIDTIRSLKDQESFSFISNDNKMIHIRNLNGVIEAYQIISIHLDSEKNRVKFDLLTDESDGTKRLLDIIPAFILLKYRTKPCVVVIDELDRSLHTKLSKLLIRDYIDHCGPNNRSQLLFTTHDMMLLDQELFRRDELWLVEKNKNSVSELVPISDFNFRSDLDIRKAYLEGRFENYPFLNRIS